MRHFDWHTIRCTGRFRPTTRGPAIFVISFPPTRYAVQTSFHRDAHRGPNCVYPDYLLRGICIVASAHTRSSALASNTRRGLDRIGVPIRIVDQLGFFHTQCKSSAHPPPTSIFAVNSARFSRTPLTEGPATIAESAPQSNANLSNRRRLKLIDPRRVALPEHSLILSQDQITYQKID